MPKRLLGVLLLLLLACAFAAPAMAVESEGEDPEAEHHELPSYDEIGTGSETSQEFRPEPYEQPTIFAGILYPLLVIAGVVVLGVLGAYLLWQPRFAQEREEKKRK